MRRFTVSNSWVTQAITFFQHPVVCSCCSGGNGFPPSGNTGMNGGRNRLAACGYRV